MTATDSPPARKGKPTPTCPLGALNCPFPAGLELLQQKLEYLAHQVRTDPLTGVANYRYFAEALEQEIERSQRNGRPTSLLMIDIDHFKRVNDNHGHEIGNQALIHVAGLIMCQVRKLDIVCRYGGEEFAVILPDTDLCAGIPVAERIRQALAATPLSLDHLDLELTASLGLATYQPYSLISADELITQADHYLYEAKQRGRNQICHADVPSAESISPQEKQDLFDLFGRGTTKDRT